MFSYGGKMYLKLKINLIEICDQQPTATSFYTFKTAKVCLFIIKTAKVCFSPSKTIKMHENSLTLAPSLFTDYDHLIFR